MMCFILSGSCFSHFTIHSLQSSHFDRDSASLKGVAKYFKELAMDELEHAEDFMKIQNQRGGKVIFSDIQKPENDEWSSGIPTCIGCL